MTASPLSSPTGRGASRLALGTAQLGIDYGITNAAGKVAESGARDLLLICVSAGVTTIDTAHGYGDSESVIGRTRPPSARFDIVTKTPVIGNAASPHAATDMVRRAFERSLVKLREKRLAALLVHHADDLLGPFGAAIWDALEDLRRAGQVAKIGVSAHDGAQVDALIDRYPIEIIQLPYNILDQRLIEGGQLVRLAEQGIEVHARSLFLQGLLLADPSAIPERFAPVRTAVETLDRLFSADGRTRLEGLIADAFQHSSIARLVCGVTDSTQLQALIAAAEQAEILPPIDTESVPNVDVTFLNPARWHALN